MQTFYNIRYIIYVSLSVLVCKTENEKNAK